MKSLFFLFLFASSALAAQPFTAAEIARWQQRAQRVTIIRDNWGVPHIYGKTDADVVFGALYTQCEDDFARVEENYLTATARLAEAKGEDYIWEDLRTRLFLDTTKAIALYRDSPPWLAALLDAFADGVNFYLHTHPEVKPQLLRRFQPWMPLMFSEGSIGGDITNVSLRELEAFYGKKNMGNSALFLRPAEAYATAPGRRAGPEVTEWEPTGSNGFAIGPSRSASGNALLLINPHTSFYFRSELHMVSEEGLNAYGASTWGQFFIYQGFNEHCGWMHTSSRADVIDEYLETVVERNDSLFYRYGNALRYLAPQTVSIAYKTAGGTARRDFTVYHTHHGPVIAARDGKWVSIAMMNEPLTALTQSYLRTKATGYKGFRRVMQLRTNSSNNTVFADRRGNIAYWHGDFIPRRNPTYDWNNPVDGSDPGADWQGLHPVKDIVQLRNPATGWLQNCNSTPFTAAGPASPDPADYPNYMAPDTENFRGVNAVRVLSSRRIFTLDSLIAAAFDPYLPGFEKTVPALVQAYRNLPAPPAALREPVEVLAGWDKRYGEGSVATSLAVLWGERMMSLARPRVPAGARLGDVEFADFMIANTTDQEKVDALAAAVAELTRDFGAWNTPWGEINRFQRLTGAIESTFDDRRPSIPVGFTASTWGSLAAYGARAYLNTKRRYGYRGNSFVAVVEFGKNRVTARSVVSGGQSSDPNSPHFNDQARMFCEGKFKDVRFYRDDVEAHAEKTYRPGE